MTNGKNNSIFVINFGDPFLILNDEPLTSFFTQGFFFPHDGGLSGHFVKSQMHKYSTSSPQDILGDFFVLGDVLGGLFASNHKYIRQVFYIVAPD